MGNMKKTKHRLRIVYEKIGSVFGEYGEEIVNPYYDGLVNFDIYLDPNILNAIKVSDWGSEEEINLWKNDLDKQGKLIKKIIEDYLNINETMYTYYVGVDDISLYLSFTTNNDYIKWNRQRILNDIL